MPTPVFNQAISLDPTFWGTYCNKASVLNSLERHEEALKEFDKAIMLALKILNCIGVKV